MWKGFVTALCVEMINEKITQKYFKFKRLFLNVRYLEDGNEVLDRYSVFDKLEIAKKDRTYSFLYVVF